jgi:hypothetical protein
MFIHKFLIPSLTITIILTIIIIVFILDIINLNLINNLFIYLMLIINYKFIILTIIRYDK